MATVTTTPGTRSGHASLEELSALDPTDIDRLPWRPVAGCSGAYQKVLWQLGGFTEALIRFAPGACTEGRPLLAAHEHIWVLSGAATIAGRRLGAGSYLHVPPGVAHRVEAVGAEGCTLLQMHRPHAPVEAARLAAQDDADALATGPGTAGPQPATAAPADLGPVLRTVDELRLDWLDVADLLDTAVPSGTARIRTAPVEDQLRYLLDRWGSAQLIAALHRAAGAAA